MGSSMTSGNKFLNPRNSLARLLFLTVFCLVVFILIVRPTTGHGIHPYLGHVQNGSEQSSSLSPNCSINPTHLKSLQQRFGLGETIEYGRRHIRFHRPNIERRSMTKIDADLFPEEFEEFNISSPPKTATCLKPIEVPVSKSPFPKSVDASDLLFGISTTFKRLNDPKISPIKEWAHWLTDGRGKSNGAGLILRLVDALEEEIAETKKRMKGMGIDVKIYHSDSQVEMAKRYLSLLPALYNDKSRPKRKYLVMCDDDTFFPSMHALLYKLSQYNHKSDLYIGTFSEDTNNIKRHGSQAFGGAGVFFSMPLARTVSSFYDECTSAEKIQESNTGWGPQGDILLRKCIYEHTEVRMTLMRDLHQLDIMGDPSGFYEAGLAPFSLHHFKGGIWHVAHPYEGAQISHACGEDCFLQRFMMKDNFIISNGYSIAYYPRGYQFDVNQVERTFSAAPEDYGWNLDFMLGPQRRSLTETGRKVAWELKDSVVQNDGSVLQSYIRHASDWRWKRSPGGEQMYQLDGVLELVWIPG